MKMREKAIEAIIDHIIEMELPDFDIIGAHMSTPEIINEEEKICKVPIEIRLRQKNIDK